jgi:hypothetical protein
VASSGGSRSASSLRAFSAASAISSSCLAMAALDSPALPDVAEPISPLILLSLSTVAL